MFQVVITNNETWAICGGRDFTDQDMFDAAMSQITGMFGCPSKIVHGDCPTGVDAMADAWAKKMAIDVEARPADWSKHGKAAGPIRNEEILVDFRPKRLVSFPGGRGTADMVARAKRRRGQMDVIEIRPRTEQYIQKGADV